MTDSFLPQRQLLPERQPAEPVGTPAQHQFRQAMQEVESLRGHLQTVRAAQARSRQTYWQQVGPVAAATVAARRALYEPLETTLLGGYLNRAEQQQVTELLLHNARSLQERFGEDETTILSRYATAPPLPTDDDDDDEPQPAPTPKPSALPPHEQAAAAARARRQQRTQQQREAQARAADTEDQTLLQNTKAAYRQLAHRHHPDRAALADAPAQQAQTALMQRITAAYAAGDLAALLTLLADTTTAAPTAAGDDLLRRYTQALAQQLERLRQLLADAQRPQPEAPWSGTEKQQRTRLRQLKRDLRDETAYLGYLRQQLREPESLRRLLAQLRASGQAGF